MGKKNFAEYQLQNTMAKTPGAVMEFLENLRKNYTRADEGRDCRNRAVRP